VASKWQKELNILKSKEYQISDLATSIIKCQLHEFIYQIHIVAGGNTAIL